MAAHIESGEYFGEIELLQGGASIATVRAPLDSEVEVAIMHYDTLNKLISESESTKKEIASVAQERLKDNHIH